MNIHMIKNPTPPSTPLPADLWEGLDADAATVWLSLEGKATETEAQRVDLVGRIASQKIAAGERHFLAATAAELKLTDATPTLSKLYSVFDLFRVRLGYSHKEVAAIGTTRLRPFTGKKTNWTLENPEKVRELLGKTIQTDDGQERVLRETELSQQINEEIRGEREGTPARDLVNLSLAFVKEDYDRAFKPLLDHLEKDLYSGEHALPKPTDKRLLYGQLFGAALTMINQAYDLQLIDEEDSDGIHDPESPTAGTSAQSTEEAWRTANKIDELEPLFQEDAYSIRDTSAF
jgi:hypothetical protein